MVCASFKGHYAALISDSSTPARSFKTTNTGTIALRGVPALLPPSFRRYQIILHGDRGNGVRETWLRFLRSGVPAGSRTRVDVNASPKSYPLCHHVTAV